MLVQILNEVKKRYAFIDDDLFILITKKINTSNKLMKIKNSIKSSTTQDNKDMLDIIYKILIKIFDNYIYI